MRCNSVSCVQDIREDSLHFWLHSSHATAFSTSVSHDLISDKVKLSLINMASIGSSKNVVGAFLLPRSVGRILGYGGGARRKTHTNLCVPCAHPRRPSKLYWGNAISSVREAQLYMWEIEVDASDRPGTR